MAFWREVIVASCSQAAAELLFSLLPLVLLAFASGTPLYCCILEWRTTRLLVKYDNFQCCTLSSFIFDHRAIGKSSSSRNSSFIREHSHHWANTVSASASADSNRFWRTGTSTILLLLQPSKRHRQQKLQPSSRAAAQFSSATLTVAAVCSIHRALCSLCNPTCHLKLTSPGAVLLHPHPHPPHHSDHKRRAATM